MPLAVSVLYLGATRHLRVDDDISVGGTGTAQVSLNRKVIDETPSVDAAAPSATLAARWSCALHSIGVWPPAASSPRPS
ncbi:hypothetical protein [Micromonospora sp. NPDC051141]|uniref:hypothetical protein n=1 Tax=Micromonospora sp. NPDC051141 TaxID=3364284 RepID=UPI0037904091